VFPSRFQEPFGISQVEAMAAGLVVVSSGTGGAAEIVRHRQDGLLFAAGNVGDLAAQLISLAQTPGLMSDLQRGAQTRAARFSVENAVIKIEALAAEMQETADAALVM
jgi:glycosyltransferase involved in cell wall biosynthesis